MCETEKNEFIAEPIRVYRRALPNDNNSEQTNYRPRVTVGKDNSAGLGNFHLNTSYINLKRLYPIIDTKAHTTNIELSNSEKQLISNAYARIMQRNEYEDFESITDQDIKNTCGPANSYYDYESISSGEDNLGTILYKLIAFQRASNKNNNLQGLLCIDEIEASLHPVAQKYLLDFLFYWSKENRVQIVATTHSLFLTEHYLFLQEKYSKDNASLINISTQQVGDDHNYKIMINPDYKTIYKELTYEDVTAEYPYKVHVLCEDDMAKLFLTRIIKSKVILSNIDFIYNVGSDNGTSWSNYIALAKNAPNLLEDSIIVFDPDVSEDKINSAKKSFKYLTKIPDKDNVPIEKRIAYYVYYTLSGDDDLFIEKEQMARQGDIMSHHVDFKNFINSSIDPFKAWKKDNKKFYNKALNRYIKDNMEYFLPFKLEIIKYINERRKNYGLPAIDV